MHPVLGGTRNPFNGFDPVIPLKMLGQRPSRAVPLDAADGVRGRRLRAARATARDTTIVGSSSGRLSPRRSRSCSCIRSGGSGTALLVLERFLTSLFPLFLIGVAELRRRLWCADLRGPGLCVAWSLMLAFVHDVGYDGITAGDGVGGRGRDRQTHGELEHKVKLRADRPLELPVGAHARQRSGARERPLSARRPRAQQEANDSSTEVGSPRACGYPVRLGRRRRTPSTSRPQPVLLPRGSRRPPTS